ncbi:hypothetical protein B296_00039566 [Ensete ventricosum]|uniref:Uncharacterized protein n=1 Tax=Ensete ventricosum TaxID=4639 RepID=A0A426ZBH8_ENSVE|nr:hypothetical protein B296_00039566 [Ensete ventricosum]
MCSGRFLKMFLGPVNVRATRKEVQLKVKEEYNSYRVFFHLLFHVLRDLSSRIHFIMRSASLELYRGSSLLGNRPQMLKKSGVLLNEKGAATSA